MHNKKINLNKSQNFIQGLRPISNSVPRGLKKIIKKNGYNFSNILDNWTKIVGKNISNVCYPFNVKIGKDISNGTLIVNVIHGNELNIEYSKKIIIDKINSFFGYKYINQVKLKVIQEEKKMIEKKIEGKENIIEYENKLNDIKNKDLKISLRQLIEAFNKKND